MNLVFNKSKSESTKLETDKAHNRNNYKLKQLQGINTPFKNTHNIRIHVQKTVHFYLLFNLLFINEMLTGRESKLQILLCCCAAQMEMNST